MDCQHTSQEQANAENTTDGQVTELFETKICSVDVFSIPDVTDLPPQHTRYRSLLSP